MCKIWNQIIARRKHLQEAINTYNNIWKLRQSLNTALDFYPPADRFVGYSDRPGVRLSVRL